MKMKRITKWTLKYWVTKSRTLREEEKSANEFYVYNSNRPWSWRKVPKCNLSLAQAAQDLYFGHNWYFHLSALSYIPNKLSEYRLEQSLWSWTQGLLIIPRIYLKSAYSAFRHYNPCPFSYHMKSSPGPCRPLGEKKNKKHLFSQKIMH